ncbi:NUDIX hydrolase [Roseivirga sp. BDSF3-8]|uniref:NUDIX hydrolase n=1 Tax=Roseivirga sp. BDSF3-8 TaxID=3241598 RepID=UPI0035321E7C
MKNSPFDLCKRLNSYVSTYPEEQEFLKRFLSLLEQHPTDCYFRELPHAHITGSAWIINPAADRVLLLHHRKLDKWLQPGGHADGDRDILQVALREAQEETGAEQLTSLMDGAVFDLDIHRIPARKQEPAHFHFDVRFLFSADDASSLQRNNESRELAWILLEEVGEKCDYNRSILRMVEKTLAMK